MAAASDSVGDGGRMTFLLVMGKNFNISASKIAAFTLMKMPSFSFGQ
jgi:hypothetical protein